MSINFQLLFFENVTSFLFADLKLNVKWDLSNIHYEYGLVCGVVQKAYKLPTHYK